MNSKKISPSTYTYVCTYEPIHLKARYTYVRTYVNVLSHKFKLENTHQIGTLKSLIHINFNFGCDGNKRKNNLDSFT